VRLSMWCCSRCKSSGLWYCCWVSSSRNFEGR
jgi:hypothetical protein